MSGALVQPTEMFGRTFWGAGGTKTVAPWSPAKEDWYQSPLITAGWSGPARLLHWLTVSWLSITDLTHYSQLFVYTVYDFCCFKTFKMEAAVLFFILLPIKICLTWLRAKCSQTRWCIIHSAFSHIRRHPHSLTHHLTFFWKLHCKLGTSLLTKMYIPKV